MHYESAQSNGQAPVSQNPSNSRSGGSPNSRATVSTKVAQVFNQLIAGVDVNGDLDTLLSPWKEVGEELKTLPVEDVDGKIKLMQTMLIMVPNRKAIWEAIINAPPPGEESEIVKRRSAHLGDLSEANDLGRFIWPGWIMKAHFTLLSSNVKIGKTHFGLDLARRIYRGELWPDDQNPTFPVGTKTLWVCGDRHQDELKERALAFGLPEDAVRLNALPENPYGGWDLDNPENIDLLRELVENEHPGLIFIDTVWRATRRHLNRETEVNELMDPIITIAQDYDVAIMGMMHLSKDNETLGRRLEGLARSIIKMFKPDPNQPDRRRLEVLGNFKEPPPLGVTIHDRGCLFDHDPPQDTERNHGGRPPEKCEAAKQFLAKALENKERKWCELVREWEEKGEKKPRIFDARKQMEEDGLLEMDESSRLLVCRLVKKSDTEDQP